MWSDRNRKSLDRLQQSLGQALVPGKKYVVTIRQPPTGEVKEFVATLEGFGPNQDGEHSLLLKMLRPAIPAGGPFALPPWGIRAVRLAKPEDLLPIDPSAADRLN